MYYSIINNVFSHEFWITVKPRALALTHVNQTTVVVQSSQVRAWEREECVEPWKKGFHVGVWHSSSDDYISQGMTNKGDAFGVEVVGLNVIKNLWHQTLRQSFKVWECVSLWNRRKKLFENQYKYNNWINWVKKCENMWMLMS